VGGAHISFQTFMFEAQLYAGRSFTAGLIGSSRAVKGKRGVPQLDGALLGTSISHVAKHPFLRPSGTGAFYLTMFCIAPFNCELMTVFVISERGLFRLREE